MSVTIDQIRTKIADRPRVYPPSGAPPEVLGTGDGVRTLFFLSYENYIAGTLTVFTAPAPTPGSKVIYTAVNPSNYTVGAPPNPTQTAATNAMITFNVAPAAGVIVGAQYQATLFSDADITRLILQSAASYSDDSTISALVAYNAIDILLMDIERLKSIHYGDFATDPTGAARNLLDLKKQIREDLGGLPNPGQSNPQLAVAQRPARQYGFRR